MMKKEVVVCVFLALPVFWSCVAASCYFPQEFQGEYLMQSSSSDDAGVQYSTLNITENSIPIWGNCHRRIGNNFILMFNFTETSVSCIRCLHLKMRSSVVLQVFVSSLDILSKCFTTEILAENNCPSEESLSARESAEILLFKTKSFDNIGAYTLHKQYCPIDGKYYLSYKGSPNECVGFNSTVNSCPSGSSLNFQLRSCTYPILDMKFDCLGSWNGLNGERYLAFTDSRYTNGLKPKFRCSIYKQDRTSGKIEMALSKDSTCTTDLNNATSGYETLILAPKAEEPWPAEVSSGICNFPRWMYGDWEHIRVQGDTIVYKNHSSFKTYTIKCAAKLENDDKYLIFTRTQCDDEAYGCMRVTKRSSNVIELQFSTATSRNKDVFTLCAEDNFQPDSWLTQGRVDITPEISHGMCPITGEYAGRIPNETYLCAKLWSDCRAPELMYYQVTNCDAEVYEQREYLCLGHWREAKLLYTYTERRDVAPGTYECFVGSIFTEKEIYIAEAGENCQRNIGLLKYGMKLIKKQPLHSCVEKSETTTIPSNEFTEREKNKFITTLIPRRTTASQDFDNSIPKETENGSLALQPTTLCLFLYLCIKLIIHI